MIKEGKSMTDYTWISVKESLPDGSEGDWVLAVAYGQTGNIRLEGAIVLASFDPQEGWFLDSEPEAPIHVTHWMPLPEPPKEENDVR